MREGGGPAFLAEHPEHILNGRRIEGRVVLLRIVEDSHQLRVILDP